MTAPARGHARRPVFAEPARTVQAIARVRLSPDLDCAEFERRLREIPAVRSAAHITGDFDYEVWLACRDVADLGAVLARLRARGGAEVASTALVLREVPGLGQPGPAIPDWGPLPRPRTM